MWEAFVSPCERRVQNQHMVTLSSEQLTAFAVLLLAPTAIKQRCIIVSAPFWIGGELPVFVVRPHSPNREVRTVMVRYEYMYRATPNIYIYIYIRGVTVHKIHGSVCYVFDTGGGVIGYVALLEIFQTLHNIYAGEHLNLSQFTMQKVKVKVKSEWWSNGGVSSIWQRFCFFWDDERQI